MSNQNHMDIEKIMRYLPHRYPFLLVDRVISCEAGKNIVACKNVTVNEPFFQGHFPIKPVMPGVIVIEALAQASGGLGAYLADWPGSRIVELWADMAKRFKQMGGNSGPYFLRMAGKDTFLLTGDVVRALNRWGAVEGTPKGKAAQRLVQEAFNRWAEETGRPFCQLSMILARSVE